jgi:hypothetical protein
MRVARRLIVFALIAAPAMAQRIPSRGPPPNLPSRDSVIKLATPAPPRRAATGIVDGLVTDTSLAPLTGAEVSVLRTSVKVETGDNGRFRMLQVPPGQYLVIIRKIGFHPTSGVIDIRERDTLRLSYALEPIAQQLPGVQIVEERRSFRMMQFEDRRQAGFGQFMTGDEIAKHGGVYATELMRQFRGLTVSVTAGGGGQMKYLLLSTTSGSINASCVPTIYVDDVMIADGAGNLDLLPSPRDMAGIEVYPGPATIPAQYFTTGACGLVLIWTKDGTATTP